MPFPSQAPCLLLPAPKSFSARPGVLSKMCPGLMASVALTWHWVQSSGEVSVEVTWAVWCGNGPSAAVLVSSMLRGGAPVWFSMPPWQ